MNKLTSSRHLQQLAERSKNFADKQNGELATAVTEVVIEIENLKADKPESVSAVISTSGWSSDNTAVYPYFYDISAEGITADDRVDVAILPESFNVAVECKLCSASQTLAGKIRLRSMNIPKSQILTEYIIHAGKE